MTKKVYSLSPDEDPENADWLRIMRQRRYTLPDAAKLLNVTEDALATYLHQADVTPHGNRLSGFSLDRAQLAYLAARYALTLPEEDPPPA